MARPGYVPTVEELIAEIMRISELHYDGLYAPGNTVWANRRPKGWASAPTIAARLNLPDAPTWRPLVFFLTGMEVAGNNVITKAKIDAWARKRAERESQYGKTSVSFQDDDTYSDGIKCCRVYETPTSIHYVLR